MLFEWREILPSRHPRTVSQLLIKSTSFFLDTFITTSSKALDNAKNDSVPLFSNRCLLSPERCSDGEQTVAYPAERPGVETCEDDGV